jgi:hypothetical protein
VAHSIRRWKRAKGYLLDANPITRISVLDSALDIGAVAQIDRAKVS